MGSFENGVPAKAFSIFMAVTIIAVNIFGVLSYVVAIRSAIKSPAADGIFIVTVIVLRLVEVFYGNLGPCKHYSTFFDTAKILNLSLYF